MTKSSLSSLKYSEYTLRSYMASSESEIYSTSVSLFVATWHYNTHVQFLRSGHAIFDSGRKTIVRFPLSDELSPARARTIPRGNARYNTLAYVYMYTRTCVCAYLHAYTAGQIFKITVVDSGIAQRAKQPAGVRARLIKVSRI